MSGQAAGLLNLLGFAWPRSDETGLVALGGRWNVLTARLDGPLAEADRSAGCVWADGEGEAIDAFRESWHDPESPSRNLADAATAATIVGVGLHICAGIVTALKVNIVAQLALLAIRLAQAAATAFVTGGLSLLEVPALRYASRLILDQLRNLALSAIVG